ncbi:C40 family peptidase [Sphaerisporangium sp. NPDC051011]|uniref:C40 family peptidase n=1 Tax=Sphaerisporangium sp. NPDC051011 TaxID=3155792 RepID=UPI0033EED78A
MLDRRPRGSTVVRKSLVRVLSGVRDQLGGALAEVREDLSFHPGLQPTPRRLPSRWLRRTVPLIAVGLVTVLAVDLVVIGELNKRQPDVVAATAPRDSVPRREGYVAAAGELPVGPTRPMVAPLAGLRAPDLFVVSRRTLPVAAVRAVNAYKGVKSVEVTDAADVMMGGKRVQTMGVNPSTFRAYTPRSTARSDALWNSVAAGDVAVSFVLGSDGGVVLGSTLDAGGTKMRVGAYATMGMGLINAVVSQQTARALGIPEGNAMVVSAPGVDLEKLRLAILKALPKGTQVALINPVLARPTQARTTWPVSAFMSPDQIRVALTAAASKLGRPYVWGAEGPDTFDCSGLVQWAFGQAGVRMPRVTHQQWVTGPQIPLAQAQPGDLLFWRSDPTNPGYISHVAIYWGDGKMLQAPRTGDVVKISPISTRNLAGVVRVSPWVAARVR